MMKRGDFQESAADPHEWTYRYRGHRFAARKNDGGLEISIRAELTRDPNLEDWDTALRTFNEFLKSEIIAKEKETG